MKKFIETTVAIKSLAAMIFAGLVIVYTVFAGFLGRSEMSFALIWQAIFISAIAAIWHFALFSAARPKRASHTRRLLLFAAPLFAVLSAFAYVFKWFSVGNVLHWLVFALLYLFFFGMVTLVFNIYFRITGQKYLLLLDAYKSRQGV